MNNKKALDHLILQFLRDSPKDEFQVKDLREIIDRSLSFKQIRQALGRLRKKKLVARRHYSSGARQWRAR